MAVNKNLFLDRSSIQRFDEGVDMKFHVPVKDDGPVLAPESPWEGRRVMLRGAPPVWCEEDSVWKIWYNGGDELLLMYAESEDGLCWKKPDLGFVPWKGSKKNNILDPGFNVQKAPERWLAVLADQAEKDESRRFKALTRVSGRLISLVSGDGLEWKPLEGASPIPSDDEFRLFFDSKNNRFAATVKKMGYPVPELGRSIAVTFSRDFCEWTPPELVFWADEIDQALGKERIERVIRDKSMRSPIAIDQNFYFTDIYNMSVFEYEGFYIGLPVMFNQSGVYWFAPAGVEPPTLGSNQDGLLYPSIAVSRDLLSWARPTRAPFIPLSPLSEERNYDYGGIYPCSPVQNKDELWFYYTGGRFSHLRKELIEKAGLKAHPDENEVAIFRARMRIDGFVSLSTGYDPGVFLSKPLVVNGNRLYINADARRGEVRAELRDADTGKVIPGYSMGDFLGDRYYYSEDGKSRHLRFGTGARLRDDPYDNESVPFSEDSTAGVISWKGGRNLDTLAGRKVRVCFHMRNSELYSFWFADKA